MKKITSLKTKVMDYVEANGGEMRRTDIIRFIAKTNNTSVERDYISLRGYFSSAFNTGTYRNPSDIAWINTYRVGGNHIYDTLSSKGYFMQPSKNEPRYLMQDKPYGKYHVVNASK